MFDLRLAALPLAFLVIGNVTVAAYGQSSDPPLRPKRLQDPDAFYKPPSTMHGKTMVLPIGTTFEGRIDQTISSEHSHAGLRFNIVIDSPVLVNGTDVVIPTGSQVIGEVVEAVPASAVPRQQWQKKVLTHGKLRIQVAGMRTPDGATYPLVASLVGEVVDKQHKYLMQYRTPLGTNVGYMGSTASYAATDPNRRYWTLQERYSRNLGPQVMAKKEFMKDEILGTGPGEISPMDFSSLRSLVLKKRDYYIYSGSPLTIRLTAPFKLGIVHPGQGIEVGDVSDEPRGAQLPPPSSQLPPNIPLTPSTGGIPVGSTPPRGATGQPQPPGAAIPPDSF